MFIYVSYVKIVRKLISWFVNLNPSLGKYSLSKKERGFTTVFLVAKIDI